ncbi:MAG TPA: undecaprenyldiphospho-muramoylpentapeptide beta-N-acetylglucosaminyltransferase [Bacteroidota bacterium]|nr:undecaprenyldiphospho-muramoylpentapeptide beta-N-acetylglucosaminyltransferase [Bacteroidota bacterium]
MSHLRAIFAGGGTGGHLFPAIAIADELHAIVPDAEILFVGTRDKLEARVVPQRGYKFRSIWISGFHRGLRVRNLLFPVKVVVSLMQARSIIRSFHPDVVVGTGGYVSGPVLRCAAALGVPTLIEEQNSYPGITTRMLAGRVDEVHLAFESSRKYFPESSNIYVSGNPTRSDLDGADASEGLSFFGFSIAERRKTLLVVGGSLGAHSINEAVSGALGALVNEGFRILWQTGTEDFRSASEAAARISSRHVCAREFIDRMDLAYAAADLVVCRAGATTIAELTRLGKPALLIPYPFAAANHQVENARALVSAGAAEMISDQEIAQRLLPVVRELFDGGRLGEMSEKSRELGKPGAAKTIAQHAIDLGSRKGAGS